MRTLVKKQGETVREYVVRVLKQNIVLLELAPGQEISVYELSEKLGVSRTPCREALLELSKIGVVNIFPQKGSKISYIDPELVYEERFLRLSFERAIVEEICDCATEEDFQKLDNCIRRQKFIMENEEPIKFFEIDNEFHYLLCEICNKQKIYDKIRDLVSIHFARARHLMVKAVKPEKTLAQHARIVEAVKKRDKEEARKAVDAHLYMYTDEEWQEVKEKYPSYFNEDQKG